MNINWQEIKEKYLNGYKQFCMHYYGWDNGTYESCNHLINDYYEFNPCYCDLEKFFDDNGIIINYEKMNDDFEYSWYYNIRVNNEEFEEEPEEFENRQKAKQQAIYKAFEILEGR